MIYHGTEKENHRGSHVKYYHCGKWHEGTLLEPVNYQVVVTKENPPAILSTTSIFFPEDDDRYEKAVENVKNGTYSIDDLNRLKLKLIGGGTEVESVEITDAWDITQEEADEILKMYVEKYIPSIPVEPDGRDF